MFETWTENLGADTPTCDDSRVWNGVACVCTPQSASYGTNNCVTGPAGTVPFAGFTGGDRASCLAYVAKYRAKFGRDPVPPLFCQFPEVKPPPRFIGPPIPYQPPPYRLPGPVNPAPVEPTVTVNPSPVYRRRAWRRSPPRVRRPHVEAQKSSSGELCPTWGYVTRPIAGVDEYQVFRCTAGQPVVIDTGLQTAGRQEALRRHGLSGLDGLGSLNVAGIDFPDWALYAGLAAIAYFVFVKRR